MKMIFKNTKLVIQSVPSKTLVLNKTITEVGWSHIDLQEQIPSGVTAQVMVQSNVDKTKVNSMQIKNWANNTDTNPFFFYFKSSESSLKSSLNKPFDEYYSVEIGDNSISSVGFYLSFTQDATTTYPVDVTITIKYSELTE